MNGRPLSEASTMAGSKGMRPRKGTSSFWAIASPPPALKRSISLPQWGQVRPLMVSTTPRTGTFVDNWLKRQTGLVKLEFERGQQSTIFSYKKPHKNKEFEHMTIKPEGMIRRLIEIFTLPGQVVLDPFLGSGTTAMIAKHLGRRWIGIELKPEYAEIAWKRIQAGYTPPKSKPVRKRRKKLIQQQELFTAEQE